MTQAILVRKHWKNNGQLKNKNEQEKGSGDNCSKSKVFPLLV